MEEGRVSGIPWQSRMRTTWAPFELGTLVDMFLSMLSMAVSQETPQSQRFLLVNTCKFITLRFWRGPEFPHVGVVTVLGPLRSTPVDTHRGGGVSRHHVRLLLGVHPCVICHISWRRMIYEIFGRFPSSPGKERRIYFI